ncbi:nitrite reductase large subunit NirB [Neobacillus drentensis]|uniref:nitrite reductase large subunit NirB n=1 Tax=Neobacillus drentensis TaxID=220684 RepID=UPI003000E8F9
MAKQKLILIGNGMAGIRCLEEILKLNPDRFDITVIGSEPHPNYNRILLSTVLQGRTSLADITLNSREWYNQHHIKLFLGEMVLKIDTDNQILLTDKLRVVSYDQLILATGSTPFMLPIPGVDKEGVISFRTIEDCQIMIETAKKYKKAVVIGGGLLGLEAARGLLNLSMDVKVVHLFSCLMERQLDQTAAKMLQTELERQGMLFLLEKETAEILGDGRVEGLRFKDGTEIEANLIIMAAGVRPNVQLAKDSGIETKRGILVNDFLETSIPNIYAVGECVEHRGIVYGLVKPLYEQGRVLAKRICGIASKGYEGSVLSTQLKISGVEVFSAGRFEETPDSKAIKIYDEIAGVYKKMVFKDDKIIGAVMFGDTSERGKLLEMILKQQDLQDIEKVAIFPTSIVESHTITSLANSELICNCNGVTKGAIIEAVQKKGLSSVEQVKICTKASGSCGGCKPMIEELLSYINSYDFSEVIEKTSFCSCTSLSEDEVVQKIQQLGLTSLSKVMDVLHWNTKQGCTKCRPALSYYLAMINPEYENIQETLFLNDRMNATLQQDGTYLVIPQMYGGMTKSEQLRKIADVSDKYGIVDIAITSEQRIHLMGIKEGDLAGVWADLNMPMSSTYGNKVQTIKTCIGEHICRCDKQSSLHLSASLEKRLEFLTTPYRVKMGVSSCLHDGASCTTKDIGVIGMERGWEIYVGGSSGRKVRGGELLCIAASDKEAFEMVTGFVQYYRETANYLERTWEWIERLTLVHIREVLFDFELLRQLLDRLEEELSLRKRFYEKSELSTFKGL